MAAVLSLTTGGLARQSHHSAVTWNVLEALGAWYVTVRAGTVSAPSIVPSGHGPTGCVVPDQLHCAPLAPFVCSSVIVQVSAGVPETPVTLACNVTWPPPGTVAVAGETVTVTLLKLVPLPPPQPAMTISSTNGVTNSGAQQFIRGAQNVRGWYTRFSAYTRQKGRDLLGSTARRRPSLRSSDERPGTAVWLVIGDNRDSAHFGGERLVTSTGQEQSRSPKPYVRPTCKYDADIGR